MNPNDQIDGAILVETYNEEIDRLQKENIVLKAQLKQLKRQLDISQRQTIMHQQALIQLSQPHNTEGGE